MSERVQQQPIGSSSDRRIGEIDRSVADAGDVIAGLVGRRADIEAVRARLHPGRVLTVTGPGGVGKTTLARAVADVLIDAYDDVWISELASAADAETMTSGIVDAIGTFRNEDGSSMDAITSALAGRRSLLILDNVEQIASVAAGVVSVILAACPDLTILVTSRVALGLDSERSWVLDPLETGEAAPRLFTQLASSIVPNVDLGGQRSTITEICVALDGLPLALELAAARLPELSVEELRDGLDQRFRVLRDRGRPDRQATLAAAVRWSYDLLEPSERRLFERVSVFQGGFDERGARAVFGADATLHDVGAMLESLAASSMLVRRSRGGRPRYEVLETLRQFGDRQLAERNERASVRNAHLDHVVDHVASAGARCHSSEWSHGVDELTGEWENVRAATNWAIDTQRSDDVDRLLRDLFFVSRWSLEAEPAAWARRAVDRGEVTGAIVGAPAHLHLAFGEFLSGDHVSALAANQAALAAAVTPSDRSWARLYAAIELLYLGRTDDAAEVADRMVADTPPRAVEQAMQGSAQPVFKMYAGQMQFEDAMDRVHRAEAVAEATGSPVAAGHVAYNKGLLLYARGDVDAATRLFRSVLDLGREHRVPNLVGYVLTSQVSAPGRSGLVGALDALSYWSGHRDLGNEFVVLEGAGINLAELGHLEPAAVILGHLDQSGRRMASSLARRESAMAEIGLQRRARKWIERGQALSRVELIDFTRTSVDTVLRTL